MLRGIWPSVAWCPFSPLERSVHPEVVTREAGIRRRHSLCAQERKRFRPFAGLGVEKHPAMCRTGRTDEHLCKGEEECVPEEREVLTTLVIIYQNV